MPKQKKQPEAHPRKVGDILVTKAVAERRKRAKRPPLTNKETLFPVGTRSDQIDDRKLALPAAPASYFNLIVIVLTKLKVMSSLSKVSVYGGRRIWGRWLVKPIVFALVAVENGSVSGVVPGKECSCGSV